jgi:hypothetical protein
MRSKKQNNLQGNDSSAIDLCKEEEKVGPSMIRSKWKEEPRLKVAAPYLRMKSMPRCSESDPIGVGSKENGLGALEETH